ncbi:MAG: bis(5'-nucleosyl)-tetraphosphatase (symmetrical) YqeK [Lachnospiraceae bacterium]|nr:bis(5'-nucleosyl)-tetraphosphatase (symmetrical) YqeK [Lachnospiraceae bacterium]MCD7766776.1 bis(5'-nucleosyl)-tetraphosphatase (symmetrical) YqeK [Lachnospiraceae bacterium]
MSGYNLIKMQNKLKKDLDEARFIHTQGVMYTAASLAMCYEQDIERASVAGLLHDCAKCIPNGQKLRLCEHYRIPVSEVERKAPHLLHAKLGASIAQDKYGIQDAEILSAIQWHTTGKPQMTILEKIIFLSDYIEPGRTKAPNLTYIRKTAFSDLDLAVFLTLRDTLSYLEEKKACLDNQTIVAYNYYEELIGEKEDM